MMFKPRRCSGGKENVHLPVAEARSGVVVISCSPRHATVDALLWD